MYAFYSPSYAGPSGNIANCFLVNDTGENPTVRGVPIPKKIGDADQYTVRKEIEIDLSMATPRQFHGILGKSKSSNISWVVGFQVLTGVISH